MKKTVFSELSGESYMPMVILRHSEGLKRRSRVFIKPYQVWNERGE